jgi:hypothetical protein
MQHPEQHLDSLFGEPIHVRLPDGSVRRSDQPEGVYSSNTALLKHFSSATRLSVGKGGAGSLPFHNPPSH